MGDQHFPSKVAAAQAASQIIVGEVMTFKSILWNKFNYRRFKLFVKRRDIVIIIVFLCIGYGLQAHPTFGNHVAANNSHSASKPPQDAPRSNRITTLISDFIKFFTHLTAPAIEAKEQNIWVTDLVNDTEHPLTNEGYSESPAWGKTDKIAYTKRFDSNNDGFIDSDDDLMIYVINADGTHKRSVSVGESPIWSPDGHRLAFIRKTSAKRTLIVLNFETKTEKVIQTGDIKLGMILGWLTDIDETCTLLVFTSGRTFSSANEFYRVIFPSESVQKLPPDPEKRYLWLRYLSPSEDQILYVDPGRTDIFKMNANDRESKINLTRDASHDFDPCWSPDGRKIAYVSDRRIKE